MYAKLSDKEVMIARETVDIAFQIHKQLGPGLLETVYERCFCYELAKRKIVFSSQHPVPIIYDNLKIDNGFRLDILIENLVIVELKASENYHPVWEAQLLSYLQLTNRRLGFLINFHVPLIKDGIKRMIR